MTIEQIIAIIAALRLDERYQVKSGGCGHMAYVLWTIFREHGYDVAIAADYAFGINKVNFHHVVVEVADLYVVDGAGQVDDGSKYQYLDSTLLTILKDFTRHNIGWNASFDVKNLSYIVRELEKCLGLSTFEAALAEAERIGALGPRALGETLLSKIKNFFKC